MKRYILIPLIVALVMPVGAHAATKAATSTTSEWSFVRPPVDSGIGMEVYSREPYENEDILKVYLVRNNRLYEDDSWRHNEHTGEVEDIDFEWTKDRSTEEYKIWNIFSGFAGKDFIKKNIRGYVTVRDPNSSTLAAVWRADIPEPSWILGVNANAADFGNAKWERDMVITLLHEYGHLLSLNKSQIKYIEKNTFKCSKGMGKVRRGCAYKKAYMSAYLTAFWDEKDVAHADSVNAQTSSKKLASIVKKYYKAHADDFVSEYAAMRPEEDFAESFTDFILQSKPASDVKEKEQKILFFYDYPELVTLRTKIRDQIASYFK